MLPELFRIGNIRAGSWGFMHIAAFVLCYLYLCWDAKRWKDDIRFIQKGYGLVVIGAVAGAKLLPLLGNFSELVRHPVQMILHASMGRFHFALIGGFSAGAAYVLLHRRSLLYYLDLATPAILLFQAIGRIGCFLHGCCFGRVTDFFMGLRFPSGSPASCYHFHEGLLASPDLPSLPVHPVQLYESSTNLILFFIFVRWVRPRMKLRGVTFALYLIVIGVERFLLEFVRINPIRWLGLSDFQLVSIGMAALGGLMLVLLRQRGKAPENSTT